MRTVAKWVALLGPVGLSPVAPATIGSAVVTMVGWYLPVVPMAAWFGLFLVGTLIAVWAAGEAERQLGHDAKPIRIDEAVGQSIGLLFVPHAVPAFVVAFVLFRLSDVLKPLGARRAEALPGGWGIVADDAVAGTVSCLTFHALRHGFAWAGLRPLG
jgi:phosphatidylglycerophosphatase A